MRLPKVIAAQRLQTLLLLTTLAAIVTTVFIFFDLMKDFRSTVVSDASKSLANAVVELMQTEQRVMNPAARNARPDAALDEKLQQESYKILRAYPDVEGGYLFGTEVVGHSFPTYTEPGSELKQPEVERNAVLDALEESKRTGRIAARVFDDDSDLVIVSARAGQNGNLSAWGLKRHLHFNESRKLQRKLFLFTLLTVALASIIGALSISFRMRRGFAGIQEGLNRLRTDPSYRLSDQHHELRPIVAAVNEMAESRQRLEDDLRREDRLRVMGRVVAGIAHEIRNPLNSIRLTVQMLARRLRGQTGAAESIPLVLAEVDRLDTLLKSLLVFAPDEPGRLRQQPVRPILERTLALVRPQMQERGIENELLGPAELQAHIDGDHLQQAVMNLLLNAIDAAGAQGRVSVTLCSQAQQVEINVHDSGPGLNPDQQEHVFEAFYTTKQSGTGLGLAVTRTLLEKMGATIEYVAAASGAHFRILLPSRAEQKV